MFQTKYNLKVFDGTYNELPSKTVQSEKENCDINVLYQRFVKERGYDPVLDGPPVEIDMDHISDVSTVDGLLGMFEKVDDYNDTFAKLPSSVREKFFNDPRNLGKALMSTDPKVLANVGIMLKGESVANETQVDKTKESPDVQKDSSKVA